MKGIFLWFILSTFAVLIHANDGVFFARGNTLIPLEETRIELKTEVLTLEKLQDNLLQVDVYFEFFNPDEKVTKTVGFVTPPIGGAIAGMDRNSPHISDFSVLVNNISLRYNIARIDSSNFNSLVESVDGDYFIYYFDVQFNKGINIIKHSYSYKGNVVAHPFDGGPTYHYKLTTGKSWANNQIDDFTLRIKTNESTFFSVPARFNDETMADWRIDGVGKIDPPDKDVKIRRVKLLSGTLEYKTNNFKPDYDLTMDILNPYATLKEFGDFYYAGIYSDPRDIKDLSTTDLRILRNSIFAVHGYKFKSKKLYDYFNKYIWYYPNENIKAEDITLRRWEKDLIGDIMEEEKMRTD